MFPRELNHGESTCRRLQMGGGTHLHQGPAPSLSSILHPLSSPGPACCPHWHLCSPCSFVPFLQGPLLTWLTGKGEMECWQGLLTSWDAVPGWFHSLTQQTFPESPGLDVFNQLTVQDVFTAQIKCLPGSVLCRAAPLGQGRPSWFPPLSGQMSLSEHGTTFPCGAMLLPALG